MHWETSGFAHTFTTEFPTRKVSPDRTPFEPFPSPIIYQRTDKKLSRARLVPGRFHTAPVMSFDEIIVESEEENSYDCQQSHSANSDSNDNNNISQPASCTSQPPNHHILSVDSVTRHHHHGSLTRHRSNENLSHAKLGLNLPPIPEEWRNSGSSPSSSRTKLVGEANNNHFGTAQSPGNATMIR